MFNLRIISLISTFALCFFLQGVYGQHRCGTDQHIQKEILENPEYLDQLQQSFEIWNQKKQHHRSARIPVMVPVHVIVVHNPNHDIGFQSNVSYERIISQIDVLNIDFARLNEDASNVPSDFTSGSTDISFCLATEDPFGNPTNGITRVPSLAPFEGLGNEIMGETIWDRNFYLNIYVSYNFGDLGLAPIPTSFGKPQPAKKDAIIVRTATFGGPGYATLPNYNLGRTVVHEVGHWFGLNHMWGVLEDECLEDDGIADTPSQFKPNFECPSHPSPSCSNNGDMFMNYMDYVYDNCMITFSAEQAEYMHFILENIRPELLTGPGTKCTEVIDPLGGQVATTYPVTCYGGMDGRVDLNLEGGEEPYNFILNGEFIPANQSLINLSAGEYNLEVLDQRDSSYFLNFTIDQPNAFLMEVIPGLNPCSELNNGTVYVSATGGNIGAYTYDLNGNISSPNGLFSDLSTGSYVATVADILGCTISDSFDLVDEEPISINSINIAYPPCGDSDSSTNVSISAETDEFNEIQEYTLGSQSNMTGLFENVEPGTYDVFVSDSRGCSVDSMITVVQGSAITIVSLDIVSATCNNTNDGIFSFEVVNATGDYETFLNGDPVDSNPIENLAPGNYVFDIEDSEGCTGTYPFEIQSPNPIEIEIVELISASCSIGGSVQVSATGGTGVLTYSFLDLQNDSGLFENLSGGDYELSVSDENGCTSSITFNLETMVDLSIQVLNLNHVSCSTITDGSIEFEITNSSGDYELILNNNLIENTTTIENLSPGNYVLEVFDASGCSSFFNFVIESASPIVIEISNNATTGCDTSGGGISASANGGSGQLIYSIGSETSASGEFTNLEAGDYTLIVTDENGCSASTQLIISAGNNIDLSIDQIYAPSCYNSTDARIVLSVTSINTNYSIILNNENLGQVSTIENLPFGDYILEVIDGEGCTDIENFTIVNPNEIVIENIFVTPNSCNQIGSAVIIAIGGTGTLLYKVGNLENTIGNFSGLQGGEYTVQVFDSNACVSSSDFVINDYNDVIISIDEIGSPSCDGTELGYVDYSTSGGNPPYTYFIGETELEEGRIENLNSGEFQLTIIDASDCASSASFFIPFPGDLIVNYNITKPECNSESLSEVNISANGGTSPYTYQFGDNENTTGSFMEVDEGEYDVLITDSNGCISDTVLIIAGPQQLSTEIIDIQQIGCSEESIGSFTINVIEGNPPFSYKINGVITENQEIKNLAPGTYEITITDSSGCTSEETVTLAARYEVDIEKINSFPADCENPNSGSLTLEATDGLTPFTYSIELESDEAEFYMENSDGIFENIPTGWYTSIVIDANNCSAVDDFYVDNIILYQTQLYLTEVSCLDGSDGIIELEIIGDSGPYSISLNGEETNELIFNNLSAAEYVVRVEDANQCVRILNVILEDGIEISAEIEIITQPGCNNQLGIIQITGQDGITPYTYTLGDEVNNSGAFLQLEGGDYEALIQDANGCQVYSNFTLENTDPFTLEVLSTQDASCFGLPNGAVTLDYLSSVDIEQVYFEGPQGILEIDPSDFVIDTFGIDSLYFDFLPSGEYLLQLTNASNCTATIEFEIGQPSEIVIENDEASFDNDTELGSIGVVAIGGIPPYSYSLDGKTNSSGFFVDLQAGEYILVVTDADGCSANFEYTISFVTGTKDNQQEELSILLYPNPSENYLILNANIDLQTISLFNTQAKNIIIPDPIQMNEGHWKFNINSLENGIYYLQINTTKASHVVKFVKI